jgi:hypothetical protein
MQTFTLTVGLSCPHPGTVLLAKKGHDPPGQPAAPQLASQLVGKLETVTSFPAAQLPMQGDVSSAGFEWMQPAQPSQFQSKLPLAAGVVCGAFVPIRESFALQIRVPVLHISVPPLRHAPFELPAGMVGSVITLHSAPPALPQEPQLFWSVERSTHVLLQHPAMSRPPGGGQALPQAPQLLTSVVVSRQLPPQHIEVVPHAVPSGTGLSGPESKHV